MEDLQGLCKSFENLVSKPEKFIEPGALSKDVKVLLKTFYDQTILSGIVETEGALPELIIKNFDEEQIWQELELLNSEALPKLIKSLAKDIVRKKDLVFFPKNENEEEINEDLENEDDEVADDENEDEEEEAQISEEESLDPPETFATKRVYKSSIVDDEFFKLSQMEEFLLQEEQNENKNDLDFGEIFFQSDTESDPEARDLKYNDFFEAPPETEPTNSPDTDSEKETTPKVRFQLSDEEETEEENVQKEDVKSTFEIRQERLKEKIKKIENRALNPKPWQMKGEISAEARPLNSLLEEYVEFDITQRPPPVITEETTFKLEDIILRRIKDKAFDDVERKIKPVETPAEFKKRLVLDQEKSKLSLAQIYEQEYLKQKESNNPETEEKPEEEPKEHQEIKKRMDYLFKCLDALSHFHFTPRPAAPEIKIISKQPAIMIEEVTPAAMSDANLLAPEEISKDAKKSLIGKDERTKTDKKRERRKKKTLQKKKRIRQEEKDKIKLQKYGDKKNDKTSALVALRQVSKHKNVSIIKSSGKAVKSSSDFFNRLQDQVASDISSKLQGENKRKKKQLGHSAKKLKL